MLYCRILQNIVERLNCAFDYGELLNSQKQAIIAYVQKKSVAKSNYPENKFSEFPIESPTHDLPEYLLLVTAFDQTGKTAWNYVN